MTDHHALRIGLTGGIGSGKSTVAGTFVELGATLIDTDAISRALTAAGGAAIEPLRAEFGLDAIDAQGALDRQRMRSLVFADPSARTRLEAILHPMIGMETAKQTQAATTRVIVFDVPLLVESSQWRTRVDRVLVVDCREATQVDRVTTRPGWTRDAAFAVIAQQASRASRRAAADAVIYNEAITLAQLADEVRALWQRWNPVEQSARSSGASS